MFLALHSKVSFRHFLVMQKITIQSSSNYNKEYTLSIDQHGKAVMCSCPYFQFSKTKECKHMIEYKRHRNKQIEHHNKNDIAEKLQSIKLQCERNTLCIEAMKREIIEQQTLFLERYKLNDKFISTHSQIMMILMENKRLKEMLSNFENELL